jgi:hypothetical protein
VVLHSSGAEGHAFADQDEGFEAQPNLPVVAAERLTATFGNIMKTYLTLLLLCAVSVRAEIEFSGFFTTPQSARFSLADPATKTSSGWLKLGQSFAGYTVDTFDAEREVLTLKRGAERLQLKLRDAKVQSGRATITGNVSLSADEKIEGVRATLFLGEEAAFPLKDDMTLHLTAERRPDGNMLYSARFVVRQPDGTDKTVAAPQLVALPGAPFSIRIGELGFAFKP